MATGAMSCVTAVLAMLASSAAAAPMDTVTADVLRTVEDGAATGVTTAQTRPSGLRRYTGVGAIPDVCVIYMEPFQALAAGDTSVLDKRDSSSGYVCNHDIIDFATVFETKKDQEKGGFTLKSLRNEMFVNHRGGWGVDWFLSVHNHYSSDRRFSGYMRAILHSDEWKAAVWDLEVLPGKNPETQDFAYALKLVSNRERGSTDTEGAYLTVPPGGARDSMSNYVAVTKDLSKATPVFIAYY